MHAGKLEIVFARATTSALAQTAPTSRSRVHRALDEFAHVVGQVILLGGQPIVLVGDVAAQILDDLVLIAVDRVVTHGGVDQIKEIEVEHFRGDETPNYARHVEQERLDE